VIDMEQGAVDVGLPLERVHRAVQLRRFERRQVSVL